MSGSIIPTGGQPELGISKWASPIGDLVACGCEVREVRGLSPLPVNVKKKN